MVAAFSFRARRLRVAQFLELLLWSLGLYLFCVSMHDARLYPDFRFGEQYARMLLMLSMVVMYSISCPLITPFGMFQGSDVLNKNYPELLVYFVFKHLVVPSQYSR